MALIEAAFAVAATRSSLLSSSSSSLSSCLSSSTQFQRNARSIGSITLLSKRRLSGCSERASIADIEDLSSGGGGSGSTSSSTQTKSKLTESLLHRFRKRKGLCVTDITSTEWCEKQQEFFLLGGKPKEKTKAMQAGIARHVALEKEVIKKVKIHVDSAENAWALKIINFIHGANQLLLDGLTRELPIISFAEGVCIIGVIDEIRMQITDTQRVPALVETKTRSLNQLPSIPQQRNGRLQLMCYKHLFDNLISDGFPSRRFLELFSLNPYQILSDEIRENTANSGFPSETLDDLLRCYQNTCSMLPLAHDQLLLRYEYQKDHSLIGEDQFLYDSSWVKNQLKCCLEFWRGEREASYAPEEERWKCKFCKYTEICPTNIKPEEDTQQTTES